MNTDLIEYKLKTAVEHLTPDIKDQILADCKKRWRILLSFRCPSSTTPAAAIQAGSRH